MASSTQDPQFDRVWFNDLRGRKDRLEIIAGRDLGWEIFEFQPWGRRLVVIRETPQEMVGGLHIPITAQQQLSQGWVLSTGPDVGLPGPPVGRSPFTPEDLVGKKVLFAKYAGTDLNPGDVPRSPHEKGLSLFCLLTDGDIHGHLINSEDYRA